MIIKKYLNKVFNVGNFNTNIVQLTKKKYYILQK